VIVVGNAFNTAGLSNSAAGTDVIVHALDLVDGTDRRFQRLDPFGAHHSAAAVTIVGQNVAVAGLSESGPGDGDYFLQTFDLTTGTPAWSDRVDEAGMKLCDWASSVIGKGKRLIGAGNVRSVTANRVGLIKVYSLKQDVAVTRRRKTTDSRARSSLSARDSRYWIGATIRAMDKTGERIHRRISEQHRC